MTDLDLLGGCLPYLIKQDRRTSHSMFYTLNHTTMHDVIVAQIAIPNKHMMSFTRSP